MPAHCAQCGSALDPGSRFCGGCGAAAAPPPSAPETQSSYQAAPLNSTTTKICPFCGRQTHAGAVQCPYCNAALASAMAFQGQPGVMVQGPQLPANQPAIVIQNVQTNQGQAGFIPRVYKNPGIALLLSLIFPGGGQFYNGHAGKGFLVLFTFWMILPWIWSLFDAYSSANRINRVGF